MTKRELINAIEALNVPDETRVGIFHLATFPINAPVFAEIKKIDCPHVSKTVANNPSSEQVISLCN